MKAAAKTPYAERPCSRRRRRAGDARAGGGGARGRFAAFDAVGDLCAGIGLDSIARRGGSARRRRQRDPSARGSAPTSPPPGSATACAWSRGDAAEVDIGRRSSIPTAARRCARDPDVPARRDVDGDREIPPLVNSRGSMRTRVLFRTSTRVARRWAKEARAGTGRRDRAAAAGAAPPRASPAGGDAYTAARAPVMTSLDPTPRSPGLVADAGSAGGPSILGSRGGRVCRAGRVRADRRRVPRGPARHPPGRGGNPGRPKG